MMENFPWRLAMNVGANEFRQTARMHLKSDEPQIVILLRQFIAAWRIPGKSSSLRARDYSGNTDNLSSRAERRFPAEWTDIIGLPNKNRPRKPYTL